MKKLILILFLSLVVFGGYYGVNNAREGYQIQQLRREIFDITGSIKQDLSNRDEVVARAIKLAAAKRFVVDPADVTIDSRRSARLTPQQQIVSNMTMFTNIENSIELTATSQWLFFRHKKYSIHVTQLKQLKAEQKIDPRLKELLDE